MYAIIESGGKQYKVKEGEVIKMDLLEKNTGDSVEFKSLLVSDKDNKLHVSPDTKVTGKILGHGQGDKIIVFKKRAKKGYKRTKGHRAQYTEVAIAKIG